MRQPNRFITFNIKKRRLWDMPIVTLGIHIFCLDEMFVV